MQPHTQQRLNFESEKAPSGALELCLNQSVAHFPAGDEKAKHVMPDRFSILGLTDAAQTRAEDKRKAGLPRVEPRNAPPKSALPVGTVAIAKTPKIGFPARYSKRDGHSAIAYFRDRKRDAQYLHRNHG
jgi:hypothetical protein